MENVPARLAVFALLVVVAGVAGLAIDGLDRSEPDAEELVESVLEGHDEFETIQGTRTYETTLHHVDEEEPRHIRVTEDIWAVPPDRSRMEIVESTTDSRQPGNIRVIDGSTLKLYQTEEEAMLVNDEWGGEGEVEQFDPVLGVDELDVEYVGTERIADRETHVVEIEPARNASIDAALSFHFGDEEFDIVTVDPSDEETNVTHVTTWWIDAERNYPLKEQVEREYENPEEHVFRREASNRTVVYEDVTFDADIPEDRFTIDPPEGTEVYEPPEQFDVETIEEADEVMPFPVPKPDVPDRFELGYLSAEEFKGDLTVELLYRTDGEVREAESVWIRMTERPPLHDDVREEGVGDVNGTIAEGPMGTVVFYYCDDVRYEIIPDLDADEGTIEDRGVEIAESMGCEREDP